MYIPEDLDIPIKEMQAKIENLEMGKIPFHEGVREVIQKLNEVEDILRDLEKNVKGEDSELQKIVHNASIISDLSMRFDQVLDIQESRLMADLIIKGEEILPS